MWFPWLRAKKVTLDDFQPTQQEQEKQEEEKRAQEAELREQTQPRYLTELFELPEHHSRK